MSHTGPRVSLGNEGPYFRVVDSERFPASHPMRCLRHKLAARRQGFGRGGVAGRHTVRPCRPRPTYVFPAHRGLGIGIATASRHGREAAYQGTQAGVQGLVRQAMPP